MNRLTIIGRGGFAREIQQMLIDQPVQIIHQLVQLHPGGVVDGDVVLGFSNIQARVEFSKHPYNWANVTAHTAIIGGGCCIGEGSVVMQYCVITTDILIGRHAQLNIGTIIGHDCVIGDFFTTAPGVCVGGGCRIGNRVYIGQGATIKDHLNICSDVTIGMGAVVVKDITQPGTYFGNPAIRHE